MDRAAQESREEEEKKKQGRKRDGTKAGDRDTKGRKSDSHHQTHTGNGGFSVW